MNAAIMTLVGIVHGIQRLVHVTVFTLVGIFHGIQRVAMIFSHGAELLGKDLAATRLGKTTPLRLVARVIQDLGDDDATHMAASVSYYAILSLFPLVLGLTAIVGIVADSPEQQEQVVDFIVDYLPGSETFVRDSIGGVVKFRTVTGIISILSLFWAGSAVFGSITRAVNRAWDVSRDPPFYKNKPRQLAMAAGISLLFWLSVSISSVIHWAASIEIGGSSLESLVGGEVTSVLFRIPAFLMTVVIFAVIYKILPNAETRWRYIWLGIIIAAALFEACKHLFLWYIGNFAQYDQVYGNIASVVVLMVWAYVSAFILILGAEIASEYTRIKLGVERGQAYPSRS